MLIRFVITSLRGAKRRNNLLNTKLGLFNAGIRIGAGGWFN